MTVRRATQIKTVLVRKPRAVHVALSTEPGFRGQLLGMNVEHKALIREIKMFWGSKSYIIVKYVPE